MQRTLTTYLVDVKGQRVEPAVSTQSFQALDVDAAYDEARRLLRADGYTPRAISFETDDEKSGSRMTAYVIRGLAPARPLPGWRKTRT